MAVQITVDNVPEDIRDELAARAALEAQTLEEFVRCELEPIASRPTKDVWLRNVHVRKAAGGTRISADEIIAARDSDRRPH